MTLQSIQYLFNCYDHVKTNAFEGRNFMGPDIKMDQQLPNDEVVEALREVLHPDLLYNSDKVGGATTTCKILKDCMVLNRLPYNRHSSVQRMSYRLVHMMYTEEDKQSRAFTLLQNAKEAGSTSKSNVVPAQQPDPIIPSFQMDSDHKEKNIVHAIKKKFKKKDRFTGKLAQKLMSLTQTTLTLALTSSLAVIGD